MKELKGNHDQFECFDPNYVFIHLPPEKRKKVSLEKPSSFFNIAYDKIKEAHIYKPITLSNTTLDPSFA